MCTILWHNLMELCELRRSPYSKWFVRQAVYSKLLVSFMLMLQSGSRNLWKKVGPRKQPKIHEHAQCSPTNRQLICNPAVFHVN